LELPVVRVKSISSLYPVAVALGASAADTAVVVVEAIVVYVGALYAPGES